MYRPLSLFGLGLAAAVAVACSSPAPTATPVPTKAPTATNIPPTVAPTSTVAPAATAAPTATQLPPTATAIPVTNVLKVSTHPKLGDIITDVSGKTLYARDGDSPTAPNCTGACLNTWPPLTPPATGNIGAPAVVSGKLEVFTRPDNGTKQIMFNGAPLYYFVRDTTLGDANGSGAANQWWTRRADGSKVAISTQPTPTPGSGGGTPATQAPKASSVQDFLVESFAIPAGTTVTWTNSGGTEHQLKSTTAPFDSPLLAPSAKFSFAFTKAGSFGYACVIHPQMTGTVTVT